MYEEVRFLKSPATVLNNIYMRMTDDSKVIIPLKNTTTRFENRWFFIFINIMKYHRLNYPDICVAVDLEPFIGTKAVKVTKYTSHVHPPVLLPNSPSPSHGSLKPYHN